MPLHVIGGGCGRTGTTSLKAALEILYGGECHHMDTIKAGHFDQCPVFEKFWEQQQAGGPVEFGNFYEDYTAAIDFPSSFFYKELLEKYPNAKVVLTVRDSNKWYKSTLDTLYYSKQKLFHLWITKFGNMLLFKSMLMKLIWNGHYEGKFEDKEFAIQRYEKWNEEVKATIPADKLLVFEVAQGWEPLCKFLGKPIPDVPFPNVNDSKSFIEEIDFAANMSWWFGMCGLAQFACG